LEAGSTDPEVRVTAFDRPAAGEVVLVAINARAAESPIRFTFRGLPPLGEARVYRSSRTEKVAALPALQAEGRALHATLKPESVTTFVCRRAG
jgi:hypothetical protein